MKKITVTLFIVALFTMAVISLSCAQRDEVRNEAYVAFTEMNTVGVKSFNAELTRIDRQLRDTQDNLVKLDQVLAPALKWVEDKKTTTDINTIPCG